MLLRFCLYGFLKNQRYFEPFLILAFLEKGLSFFAIGLLVAYREIVVNVLEIPSGAIADVFGRRRSMMVSFVAYIVSFASFGFAQHWSLLVLGMTFFALGDAFRTGTHKAMIFNWLRLQGRLDERTRVYGLTRSWSKLGSALSVLIACVFVYWGDSYTSVFFFAMIPYVLSLINFLGYPQEIDPPPDEPSSLRKVIAHFRDGLRLCWQRIGLRRKLFEAMGFEGTFHVVKDYLQPILFLAAFSIGTSSEMSDIRRSTLLIGPVFFAIHLLSAFASRRSHQVVSWSGGEDEASKRLWWGFGACFALMTLGGTMVWIPMTVLAFLGLHAMQNLWRPVLISRIDSDGDPALGATILSIESQVRRVGTMILAPALGAVVDWTRGSGAADPYWPVGLFGLGIFAVSWLLRAFAAPAGTKSTTA